MESNEQFDRAWEAILDRVVFNAIDHLDTLDSRTVLALQSAGRLQSVVLTPSKEASGELFEVVSNPSHPHRLNGVPGPLVFVQDLANNRREVLSLSNGLLFPEAASRSLVLSEVERIARESPRRLTPRTQKLLSEKSEATKASDPISWRRGAIEVSDALNEDWLLNVMGLRQCLEVVHGNATDLFAQKVLFPTIRSIDSIDLKWWDASRQRAEIEERLASIVKTASSLSAVMDEYYDELGHLALSGTLSLGHTILSWADHQAQSPESVWMGAWKWLETKGMPVAQYHLCQAFVYSPRFVPSAERPRLWREVAEVVGWQSRDRGEGLVALWEVFVRLAHHYYFHLVNQLPWNESARIAAMSWWMSKHVVEQLGVDMLMRSNLRSVITQSHLGSSFIWHVAHPPVQPSDLGAATSLFSSLWSVSLLYQLGDVVRELGTAEMSEAERKTLHSAIHMAAMAGFPARIPKEAVYGFQLGPENIASIWADQWDNDETKRLVTTAKYMVAMHGDKEFISILRDLDKGEEPYQKIAADAFHMSAYVRTIPLEELWTLINEVSWRERTLPTLSEEALQTIFNGLAEIQVSTGGKWLSHLPHIYALSCEAAKDEKRRRVLFALTLLSSLHSDTTSALARLFGGRLGPDLRDDAKRWMEQLEILQVEAPPWIACRIGAILAALEI